MKRSKRNHFNSRSPKVFTFETPLDLARVDPEEGIIRGVSVITSGVIAKGHDLEVDGITLVQMLECAEKKNRVPTKWNHKTGADAVSGYLKNFRIEGDRLRADWHLLKSHPQYAHAIELAQKMPDGVGLSVSFTGESEKRNGKTFARCDDLISTDLVANPAANPTGLFAARQGEVDRNFSDMPEDLIDDDDAQGSDTDAILAYLHSINERLERIEDFQDELQESLAELEDDDDDDDGDYDDVPDDQPDPNAHPVEAAFNALHNRIHNLEAREVAKVELAEKAEEEHAFDVLETKTQALLEELEAARTENEILREFMDQAEANGALSMSVGSDAQYFGARNMTDYEKRIHELCEGGMKRTEAIRKANSEGNLQITHLQQKGVIKTL